ncbi:DUF2924 domain-containing protein [Chelativorans sp. M5D2P16]|uniref:DUF2924 domain-containing protein n=1 Tax=Chelativorans sp. M5D2P16 TaxID=3095678 RepID=UPI002ACADF98|nr:DUF2924 domain-containing protein [Chelativorans sp. M5D2P16]MDZ5699849.1 DUF2924 domain-containing protein [Chelativorans sp. M5D2P16]
MKRLASDVAVFDALNRDECIARWKRQFGRVPPKYMSLRFMRRALAHEAQLKVHGGHSSAVRRALKTALKEARHGVGTAATSASASSVILRPGTHLVREWNGRTYRVEVLEKGFLLDGKTYRSLSAVARRITGAHWSGPRFFGLGLS